jgi:GntR family transcriptional regulator
VEIEIDYDAPEPPHRQIAAWLRGKIESGELQPGRKIPSEKDIMDMTGVARTTARRAVAVLRDEGLVVTTPGRGTHVAKRLSLNKTASSLPGSLGAASTRPASANAPAVRLACQPRCRSAPAVQGQGRRHGPYPMRARG